MEFLILSARRFDFKDDDDKRVEGVTLTYADLDDTTPDADRRGLTVVSITAPLTVWPELRQEPGLYRMDFRHRPGRGGKTVLQCVGVSYVGPWVPKVAA